jgi:hypothetical protein
MRQVADMSRMITFESYKPFSVLCERASELTNNDEFYKARYDAFMTIYPPFLESEASLFEVGLALLAEGGYLIRQPKTAEKILTIITSVSNKFGNWERTFTNVRREEYRDSDHMEEDEIDED